jgi:ankyrin repeat protein
MDISIAKWIIKDYEEAVRVLNEEIRERGYKNIVYELTEEMIERINSDNINKMDEKNNSIIHYMSRIYGSENMMRKIIEREDFRKINEVNSEGETAIMEVCKNNKEELAVEMIRRMSIRGIKVISRRGESVINYGIENGMVEVLREIKMKYEREGMRKNKMKKKFI